MTEGGKRALLLVLSVVWIALVSGYMVWGAVNETGLYGWLAERQVAQFGSYYPKWTAILPALLLGWPAIWYLRHLADRADAQAPAGPAGEAQRIGRTARIIAVAGIAAGLIGGGAYVYSQTLPDGSEEALPFDITVLGTGAPVPAHKIRIRGDVDPEAATGVTEAGRGRRTTVYAGFRPESAAAKDAPLGLFIERNTGSGAMTAQGFLPDQDGYLIENGLPALALSDFEARGIRVARPHYLLRPGDDTRREPYYVVAALGGFLCITCLVVALIGAVQARNRARRT